VLDGEGTVKPDSRRSASPGPEGGRRPVKGARGPRAGASPSERAQGFARYLPFTRSRLRFLLVATGCLVGQTSSLSLLAGSFPLLLGMGLHLWTRGHLHLGAGLIRTGPYRWVRHPFYLAGVLVDLGLCIVIARPVVAVVYAGLWIRAYLFQIRHEEADLRALHGKEHDEYVRRVPLLIPLRKPWPRSEGGPGFSWRNPQIARGREIPRLLRMASYPLLLTIATTWRTHGTPFPEPRSLAFWLASGGFVVLSLGSVIVQRFLLRRVT